MAPSNSANGADDLADAAAAGVDGDTALSDAQENLNNLQDTAANGGGSVSGGELQNGQDAVDA